MTAEPPDDHRGRVTAVVLSWRDVSQTVACVRSLLRSGQVLSVIVVDNESTGQLRDPLERIGDRRIVLAEEELNLGFAGGVNVGLRMAAADPQDLVLVINNDAHIEPDSLGLLVSGLLADPGLALVAPRILGTDGNQEPSWGALTASMSLDRSVPPSEADYFTWACVLFRKTLLKDAGYLDDGFFMYWEDVEFGRRMRRLGLSSGLVPLSTVSHATSSSHVRAGSVISAYSCHGLLVLARKEGRLLAGLVRVLGRATKRLVQGDLRGSKQCLRGALLALRHPQVSGAMTFSRRAVRGKAQ